LTGVKRDCAPSLINREEACHFGWLKKNVVIVPMFRGSKRAPAEASALYKQRPIRSKGKAAFLLDKKA
jgi:hypothetical protein